MVVDGDAAEAPVMDNGSLYEPWCWSLAADATRLSLFLSVWGWRDSRVTRGHLVLWTRGWGVA